MSEAAHAEDNDTGGGRNGTTGHGGHSRTNAGALARQRTLTSSMHFKASDSDGNGRLEFDEVTAALLLS